MMLGSDKQKEPLCFRDTHWQNDMMSGVWSEWDIGKKRSALYQSLGMGQSGIL